MSALSLSNTNWHGSNECLSKVLEFHDKKANLPRRDLDVAKRDYEETMRCLKTFLDNKGLCKRVEYTGSIYEGVHITDDLEFDVMFVRDGKLFKLAGSRGLKKGYSYIRTIDNMHDCDKMLVGDNLDPIKYAQYFFGIVQQWINKMSPEKIKLRKHGDVAAQIDVQKNGMLWYSVDLVPCIEIGSELYVPKPVASDGDNYMGAWRHSFSLKEKEKLTSMDEVNECRRKVIRIIKAIFKKQSHGLFKSFTSYHIKTVAFRMQKKRMSWHDRVLGKCVMLFLTEVKECLEKGSLMHYFEPSINLLENLLPEKKQQMVGWLSALIKSDSKFYDVLGS